MERLCSPPPPPAPAVHGTHTHTHSNTYALACISRTMCTWKLEVSFWYLFSHSLAYAFGTGSLAKPRTYPYSQVG